MRSNKSAITPQCDRVGSLFTQKELTNLFLYWDRQQHFVIRSGKITGKLIAVFLPIRKHNVKDWEIKGDFICKQRTTCQMRTDLETKTHRFEALSQGNQQLYSKTIYKRNQSYFLSIGTRKEYTAHRTLLHCSFRCLLELVYQRKK